jgi:DNA polymerase-3 subunit epsilon/ATP-dependent DNA helicase DinG
MPKTYVSIDLETTGLNASRDAIIEIGAVRFDQERAVERFSTFVNPGRKIPPFITELTGIRDQDVATAMGGHEATQLLAEFAGRDPVIGHNVKFDLAFLRRHHVLQGNTAIDTFEMAGILVPHARRYSLANLVKELGIDFPDQTHRALDDAEMTQALFLVLMERAVQLSQDHLQEIVRMGRRVRWGGTHFFEDALYRRQRHGFQGGIGAQLAGRLGAESVRKLFAEESYVPPLEPRKEPRFIGLEALTAMLQPGGEIADSYPGYEYRGQQVEMMQAVGSAFNLGGDLLVEAGTGTGKSLAYLLPAVEWSVLNRQRVVISTNTINLQEQLANKDIPQLAEALYDFRWQILKGRSHYLCRRQFETMRRRGATSEDEVRVFAKVLLWLPHTLDGDGDDLFLPTPGERHVWHTLSAANEACDLEHCPFFQSNACFFYDARAKAESAHLVIVNHALLLADVASKNRVLPDYDVLIVDEAHHLERATTESMRYTVSWQDLSRAFDDLLRPSRGIPGLLDEILAMAQRLPAQAAVRAQELVLQLKQAADRTRRYVEMLFTDLEVVLRDRAGKSGGYGLRLRVTDDLRQLGGWDGLIMLWSQAEPHFEALTQGLAQMVAGLGDAEGVDEAGFELPEVASARSRLLGVQRVLGAASGQLRQFIVEPGENSVYWMETRRRGLFTLNVVPLDVSPLIQENILAKNRSVIFTSATLRIEGSFDYIRERLGIGREAAELAVGSPFDYPSVALLYAVSDIPEPRSPGYQKRVNETLIELFQATEGRALALFTSYSQLKATTTGITEPLGRAGITVLSQGTGTSRAQLLESFRTGERVVLMGTRSFWEGVDVTGEALSCLVIAKLPFDVPDDPIVSARSQAYEDPFGQFMVPEAVLRFLQGFGRLIRTAADQGIAVVLDRRILTKQYGRRFVDSLPDPTVIQGPAASLPLAAARWLAGKSLPGADLSSLSEDEVIFMSSGEDPAGKEPDWFWGA